MFSRFLLYLITLFFISNSILLGSTLTGEIIREKIVLKLAENGMLSDPAIEVARQFPTCKSDLKITNLFGSWKTVKVSCPENSWKLVIRTNVGKVKPFKRKSSLVDAKTSVSIVVLNTSLNKNALIKEEHLEYSNLKKNIGGGIFFKKKQLVGRKLKVALSVGTVIRSRHLETTWTIQKDQLVIIEHQVGNILISAEGKARESGQMGDRIWVNNVKSGRKVLCWIKNGKKVTTKAKVY